MIVRNVHTFGSLVSFKLLMVLPKNTAMEINFDSRLSLLPLWHSLRSATEVYKVSELPSPEHSISTATSSSLHLSSHIFLKLSHCRSYSSSSFTISSKKMLQTNTKHLQILLQLKVITTTMNFSTLTKATLHAILMPFTPAAPAPAPVSAPSSTDLAARDPTTLLVERDGVG